MTPAVEEGVITLDASLLISHLNVQDQNHPQATSLLLDAADYRLCMNTLNVAEVLVGFARVGALDVGERVFAKLGIEEVPMSEDAASRLAVLRAETGLKMPDCCVLLTAQDTKSAVASFDADLCRAAERLGLAILPNW